MMVYVVNGEAAYLNGRTTEWNTTVNQGRACRVVRPTEGWMDEAITGEVTSQGLNKVKRYKWSLKDGPGLFEWINKNDLLIDHTYQRRAMSSKVLNIAREWSWIACGCLLVARRHSNSVMDGQYRTLAARKRSDITELPCMVFEVETIQNEAQGFLDANTHRKPVSALDKYRALLTAGDETAAFIDELVTKIGRTVGDSEKNSVGCVALLMKCATTDREKLIAIWPLINKIAGTQKIHSRLIDGMIELERRMSNGQSLSDTRWRSRIVNIGADELIMSAGKAAAYFEKGGARVFASGMLQRINHGLRHKLVISSLE